MSGCCEMVMGDTSWAFHCNSSFDTGHSSVWLWPKSVRSSAVKEGTVSLFLALSAQLYWSHRGAGARGVWQFEFTRGVKSKLPPAFTHCWSMEALWLEQPPLCRVWGWEGTRDIKAERVGPYRGAKGWYSGDCNSVNAYLNSRKKARII